MLVTEIQKKITEIRCTEIQKFQYKKYRTKNYRNTNCRTAEICIICLYICFHLNLLALPSELNFFVIQVLSFFCDIDHP